MNVTTEANPKAANARSQKNPRNCAECGQVFYLRSDKDKGMKKCHRCVRREEEAKNPNPQRTGVGATDFLEEALQRKTEHLAANHRKKAAKGAKTAK